jgi:hypothetical protein
VLAEKRHELWGGPVRKPEDYSLVQFPHCGISRDPSKNRVTSISRGNATASNSDVGQCQDNINLPRCIDDLELLEQSRTHFLGSSL